MVFIPTLHTGPYNSNSTGGIANHTDSGSCHQPPRIALPVQSKYNNSITLLPRTRSCTTGTKSATTGTDIPASTKRTTSRSNFGRTSVYTGGMDSLGYVPIEQYRLSKSDNDLHHHHHNHEQSDYRHTSVKISVADDAGTPNIPVQYRPWIEKRNRRSPRGSVSTGGTTAVSQSGSLYGGTVTSLNIPPVPIQRGTGTGSPREFPVGHKLNVCTVGSTNKVYHPHSNSYVARSYAAAYSSSFRATKLNTGTAAGLTGTVGWRGRYSTFDEQATHSDDYSTTVDSNNGSVIIQSGAYDHEDDDQREGRRAAAAGGDGDGDSRAAAAGDGDMRAAAAAGGGDGGAAAAGDG
eukprot:Lankesteria_metandrocarpae@DN6000_c1_g1_i1.p1